MLTPGFIIKNDTIWPLQISLNQVGPLYYDVIQPGQSFVRTTGAVWFTIKASVFLDEKDRITVWDCVWPIATITGTVLLAAATAGATAYAAGPALAAAGAAGWSGVTGLSSASALATATAASTLVGAGFSASASLVIGGAVIGGAGSAATTTITAALKDIFSEKNCSLSQFGCYAGPPWPFRENVEMYRVVGGPIPRQIPGKNQVELIGQPLRLVQGEGSPVPPPVTVALQASNGQFVCAEGGGGQAVVANRNAIGSWETFTLLTPGSGVALSFLRLQGIETTDNCPHVFGIGTDNTLYLNWRDSSGGWSGWIANWD